MSQHAEPSGEPLTAPFDRWLAAPDTRAMLRTLLGAVPQAVEVGLPRIAATGARGFRGPEVMLTCSRSPDDGARQAMLTMPVEQAAAWVDRVLGGSGQLGVAAHAGKLSDAECGVLAYAGARLIAASGAPWLVRDVVSASAAELEAACADAVVWPVRVSGALASEAKLVLSAQAARELVPALVVDLMVSDRVDAQALEALEAGDVLTSDALRLTATTEGACGPVRLRVRGCADQLQAMLERGRVEVLTSSSPALARERDDELVLVLARRTLDLLELARVVAGSAPAFTALALGPVDVEHSGRRVARGELVSYRGSPSVRITRCESAASPAPQRA